MADTINIIIKGNLGEGFEFDDETKKINVDLKHSDEAPKSTTPDTWLVTNIGDRKYYIPAVEIFSNKTKIRPYYFKDVDEESMKAIAEIYASPGMTVEQYADAVRNESLNIKTLDYLDSKGLIPTLDEALKNQGRSKDRPETYNQLNDPQLEYVIRKDGNSYYLNNDWKKVRELYGYINDAISPEILRDLEQKGSIPPT